MGHGTPKSDLISTFKQRIADLERKAQDQSEHFRTHGGTRPWHTPDSMESKDLLDVPNLHEPAWNRDDANSSYANDVLSLAGSPGTHGDLIALKRQIDFMAAEERAWRARHASFARCASLAAGRLNGHGQIDASIFTMMKNAVENARLRGRSSRGSTLGTEITNT